MANLSCGGLTGTSLDMCLVLNEVPFSCPNNSFFIQPNGTSPYCVQYASPWAKSAALQGMDAVLDTGNTAFMLGATALVMIMTPGVGLFYAGLAGVEVAANTMLMSVASMCIVSIQWFLVGYSFAFGPGSLGFGSFYYALLLTVGGAPSAVYGIGIPHILYCVFQCMFAMITPALISGSVIGRMKFTSWCIFVTIWTTFVYDAIAHWFWSLEVYDDFTSGPAGWLGVMGVLDFAGGSVIHISSGFAGLAAAIVLGKRVNHHEKPKPHNVPLVMLGATLLWFGWFGFNAGSATGIAALNGRDMPNNLIATNAFMNTHLACATAALSWTLTEKFHTGSYSATGVASGIVAGLVAITPGCGFVMGYAAFLFGLVVSPVCYFTIVFMKKIAAVDDTLDSFALHGIGGMVGGWMTGLFAAPDVNSYSGGFYYNGRQFGVNVLGTIVSAGYSFVCTIIIMLALKYTIGVRIEEDHEREGIDLSEHGAKTFKETEKKVDDIDT